MLWWDHTRRDTCQQVDVPARQHAVVITASLQVRPQPSLNSQYSRCLTTLTMMTHVQIMPVRPLADGNQRWINFLFLHVFTVFIILATCCRNVWVLIAVLLHLTNELTVWFIALSVAIFKQRIWKMAEGLKEGEDEKSEQPVITFDAWGSTVAPAGLSAGLRRGLVYPCFMLTLWCHMNYSETAQPGRNETLSEARPIIIPPSVCPSS